MIANLTGTARSLGVLMSRISEDVYGAGWLHDVEWELWKALLQWRQFGRDGWPHSPEFGEDLALYMWELDWLQRQSGGWVWWLDGEEFVPEERWLRLVEARGADVLRRMGNARLAQVVAR